MRIIPINDFVVIRKEEVKENVTSSGLIIPVTKKPSDVENYHVTAVSKDCKYLAENDSVVFPIRMGTEFEIDGVDYIAINERNVMCKIEED
jgi:co-chaperonin GroES (HSP10)